MFSVYGWFILILQCHAIVLSDEPRQNQGRWLVDRKQVEASPPSPVVLLLAISRRLFCFGSLVILDVSAGRFLS